ncbi:MAG TPA: recombinase zinc beta ribbon domain-containing protein [Candidatus Saccharimonadales bacterium]|nr:recombinase zinc beta ribbon domain-containing protein [Candidatus Saccharimonadales bacterium]
METGSAGLDAPPSEASRQSAKHRSAPCDSAPAGEPSRERRHIQGKGDEFARVPDSSKRGRCRGCTIFCGRCGTRLGLTHATGRRGGTYLYFYCLGRQYRNGCDLPYLQVDDVEDAVQGLYASVQLTPEERAQLQSEVSSILRGEKSVADKERKRLTRQIDGLKRQRYIWADKVATGGVPDDIGRERQAGLTRQLNRANAELAALDAGGTDFEQTLDRALELASVCVKGYEQAGDHDKRLWNQTFFSQIKVLHPDHATPVLSPTFAALRPLGESSGSENERQTSRRRSESTNPGRVFLGQGSNKRRMVEVLGRYSNLRDQGERVQTLLQIVPEGTPEVNLRTPRQVQRRLSPDQTTKLIASYEAGETVKELARRHNLHRETVSKILTRHDITRRPKGIPTERIAEVIADYESGLSLATIGGKLSVEPATVTLALRRAGIELRPRRGWLG